ncbi:MAG: hypothetical protein IJH78_09580 [Clostridia bacterium]|nr:hypothetical protein [Clostridia bacterium]
MPNGYYGDQNATRVISSHPDYPGIRTPEDLYRALLHVWSADTCAPRMREKWSPEDPTLGQCSITAFLAQDIFGGKVRGVLLGDGNFHCFNTVEGTAFDLTSGQFAGQVLKYDDAPEQSREVHFAKEEKRRRYELLAARLRAYLAGRGDGEDA